MEKEVNKVVEYLTKANEWIDDVFATFNSEQGFFGAIGLVGVFLALGILPLLAALVFLLAVLRLWDAWQKYTNHNGPVA